MEKKLKTSDKKADKRKHSRESFEDILKHVNKKYVKIKNKEKINNNKILHTVVTDFLKRMCSCDELFANLKPRLGYLGSYYEGLRVGKPTEYDLNVILKFPVNYDKIVLDSTDMGAYTSIIMPSEFRRLHKMKGFIQTEMWCDKSYRLSVNRFKSWMQRVVDATLNTLPLRDGMRILEINNITYKISTKISGPANTLKIFEDSNPNNVIDIDLVPTLTFKLSKKPTGSTVQFNKINVSKLDEYFVVPKPNICDYKWRLAFPFQERHYLHKKYNMKSVIKLLKLLRDVQGFNQIASYYIKTLFLWECEEASEEFWKRNSLSFLFVYMLKKLKDSLLTKEIRNFWCPEHNLLEKLKTETALNWANRVSYIINVIEKNIYRSPSKLKSIFKIRTKDFVNELCL